ncbi:MAG: iron ABC transporter permease [Dehalococcoidia bacterium]|nr:iron ABC transporter permease [Dehalococcoidia bacterium]
MSARAGRVLLALPLLALLAVFLGWPLGTLVARALALDGAGAGETVRALASDRYYWERAAFTTGQALASTALTLLVGVPAAYALARVRFPGRALLGTLLTVPFVLPTLVVALAFQQLLGPRGWLNDGLALAGLGPLRPLGTLWLILAAHVFYNVSIVVRLVGAAWSTLDPATEEAARTLGAGRVRAFTASTLPQLAPAIAAAGALVFMFCFTSFGVVLVLGAGNPHLDTLEVVVYRLTTRLVDLPSAALLALVQIAVTLGALVLYGMLQRRGSAALRSAAAPLRPWRALRPGARALLALLLAGLLAFVVLPLAALVHAAFTLGASELVTARHVQALFRDTERVSYIAPLDALRWSLTFATSASLAAAAIGLAAALVLRRLRGRVGATADALLMAPLAVPAVVLGFGYLVTFNRGVLDLRGSPWLLFAAHTLLAYPFVVRALVAALRALDPQLAEAARVLGASPRRAWRHVEFPLIAPALAAGAAFAFAISIGEFGTTLLLQRREFATIPIAIYDSLARPGDANVGRALVLACGLLLVTGSVVALIDRVRYRVTGVL